MVNSFPGQRHGQRYDDLYMMAEIVDLNAYNAYTAGHLPRLYHLLATDDTVEHCLTRIGAEVSFEKTGDYGAFRDMLSAKPPGHSELMPDWELTRTRDRSRALGLQRERVRTGRAPAETDEEVPGGQQTQRRTRRAPRKAGTAATPSADGGGGGAAASPPSKAGAGGRPFPPKGGGRKPD